MVVKRSRCQSPVNTRESREFISKTINAYASKAEIREYIQTPFQIENCRNEMANNRMPVVADKNAGPEIPSCTEFSNEPPCCGHPGSQEKLPATMTPTPNKNIRIAPSRVRICFGRSLKRATPNVAINIPEGIKPAKFIKSA